MLLDNKKVLMMGIRNKWSIAWGIATEAAKEGAELIFTYQGEENKEKIESLLSEIRYKKAYSCDASDDKDLERVLREIKRNMEV